MVLIVEAIARLLLHKVQQVGDGCKNFATAENILSFNWNVELAKFGADLHVEQLANLFNFCTQLAVQLVATNA